MTTGSEKDVVSDRVQRLLGQFVQQMRSGTVPDVAEFCAQAGDEASTLEPMLRTLLSLESLREAAGKTLTLESFYPVTPPTEIGDFQLIRMLGRGGMGVVYEAIELTLGRRVAIKLLEPRHAVNPRSVKRFLREAQAAARLHHTNILPVFASGEDAGIRYYAMQFVDGCTLSQWIQRTVTAVALGRKQPLTASDLTANIPASPPYVPAATNEQPQDILERTSTTETRVVVQKEGSYYRRVAEIGLQIAEALEHAAAQGVLHRDVKPSNVMLGVDGSVWVMDFGLATVQQAENLTESGELLGTLRYMAPERLSGQHTLHGDMFGLGMILYELVALRSAYEATERSGLRHQVSQASPTSLRKLDNTVPFDLETIAMKCIAADPRERYRDMQELVRDLRLFFRDRPIASRRTSLVVQGWRWSKRNPLTALLVGATAVLLMALAGGSMLWAQSLRRERNVALAAEAKAVASEQRAIESSLASRRAERSSQEALELARRIEEQRKLLLFRTLLDEMHSAFASESSGQRQRGIQAAREVLDIIPWNQLTTDQKRELRDATVACLSVADTQPISMTQVAGPLTVNLDVDPGLTVLATHDGAHNTLIVALDGKLPPKKLTTGQNSNVFRSDRSFSPCGRWLYERHQSQAHDEIPVRVWDWRSGSLVLELESSDAENAFCFDRLGDHLYQLQASAISVYQLPSGKLLRTSTQKFRGVNLAISEDGKHLACLSRSQPPCLLDPETFQVIDTLEEPISAISATWDPVHGELLIGTTEPEMIAWNPWQRLTRRHPMLKASEVTSIQLDQAGQTLAIRGRGVSEILHRGRLSHSLGIAGDVVRMSADGQRFAVHRNNQVELHRLVPSNVVAESGHGFSYVAFCPDGQSLSASGPQGVQILDAKSLAILADLGLDQCGPAPWNPNGGELATYGTFSHLSRWRIDFSDYADEQAELQPEVVADQQSGPTIGPPRPVQLDPRRAKLGLDNRIPQHKGRFSVWHPNGKWLYFVDYRHHLVYRMEAETEDCEELGSFFNPVSLDVSPDGRWLAVGQIMMNRVSLLDLSSRQVVAEVQNVGQPKFSWDSSYLVVSNFEEVQVYSTVDWQAVHRWPTEASNRFASINTALSPKSNLLAAAFSDSQIRLFDMQTGEHLSDLRFQRSDPINCLAFDGQCRRLVVARETSTSVWDLAQLGTELNILGIEAPFLPECAPEELSANSASDSLWTVDRGSDLLDADRWWTGYQILAAFEAMSMNYADAIDNMDKALAMVKKEDRRSRIAILVRRAKYQLASNNARHALSDLRQAQRLQPDEPMVLRELAELLADGPPEIQDPLEAKQLLEQLSELESR